MANGNTGDKVLLNGDLLELIVKHLPQSDIASIRLCNKHFEAVASPYLFRTLVISSAKTI